MTERTGASSRCCTPRSVPLVRQIAVNNAHPEVLKLGAWLEQLDPWAMKHELGEIEALFTAAREGRLIYIDDETTEIKPIRLDPDMYELRHTSLSKKLRFYHGEPEHHPDLMVSIHEHIKTDDEHQQEQIEYAVSRYRPPGYNF